MEDRQLLQRQLRRQRQREHEQLKKERRPRTRAPHEALEKPEAWGAHILCQARLGQGIVWRLACQDRASSLAVQRALEMAAAALPHRAPAADLGALLSDLHGRVVEASWHPVANFVLSRALELGPPDMLGFVAQEMLGRGVELAKGRISCRAVLRVFRHLLPAGVPHALAVAAEVLQAAPRLVSHGYGSYVIQELFASSPQHRAQVVAALRREEGAEPLLRSATGNCTSRVLEHVLTHGDPGEALALIQELLPSRGSTERLCDGRFGRHVAKLICGMLPCDHERRRDLVQLLNGAEGGARRPVGGPRVPPGSQ